MSILPGAYAIGSVLFSPAAAVLNADPVYFSGTWTLNTDDLTFGVHVVNFTGTVISPQVGPQTSSGTSLFQYLGCFLDLVNGTRIEQTEYVNANNTNGLCQTQAEAFGAVFAGTEYMTQCFVGSIIPQASLLVEDYFCSYACAGDATQICGGSGGYLSVYYDTTKYFPLQWNHHRWYWSRSRRHPDCGQLELRWLL